MSKPTVENVCAVVNEFDFSNTTPEAIAEKLHATFPDNPAQLKRVVNRCVGVMPVLSAVKYYRAIHRAL